MQTAQIIPFHFEAREVRTVLINDQPWFFAVDVCASLGLSDTNKALIGLDDDEKREHEQYSGSGRRPILINESGLYSLILRSRKAEAKRFKKWVTAEVLPAIRKHGRYEDTDNRMATLVGQTIGTDGFHMLGAVVKGKVSTLPVPVQRRATAKIWSQTHAAFGVRSAADIPADQLDSARNFIAAYALEGEWLRKETSDTFAITFCQAMEIGYLLHSVAWVNHRWHQGIEQGVKGLNHPLWSRTFEHVDNMARAGRQLDQSLKTVIDAVHGVHQTEGVRPEQASGLGII